MSARAIFVGSDGRPRAPWRLAVFLLVASVVTLLLWSLSAPAIALLEDAIGMVGVGTWIALAVALVIAHGISVEWVERRPWRMVALGTDAARPRRLLEGAALGTLAIGVPIGVLWAVGWLTFEPAPEGSWWAEAARVAIVLAPAAFAEELLVRGYLFAVVRETLGTWAALLLSSITFGMLHLDNPGATPVSIAMVVLAGVFLGGVVVAMRSLYAAWMAHLAWNFTLAGFFHVPVSGLGFRTPGYRLVESGPDLITGGSWGPEGGIAAGVGMLGALAYLIARPGGREES